MSVLLKNPSPKSDKRKEVTKLGKCYIIHNSGSAVECFKTAMLQCLTPQDLATAIHQSCNELTLPPLKCIADFIKEINKKIGFI